MRHLRAPAPQRLPWILTAVVTATVAVILGLFLVRGMTYREAVDTASALPAPLQSAAAALSEYGILGLIALFGLAALHARRKGLWTLARGIAAGMGVVLAYLSSETIKALVTQLRPCRNFAVTTIAECPEATDWSWPSNHATIAVALAVAVLAMSPRLALAAMPLAGMIAVSRVVVGVHYAHDVLAGALLGTLVVIVCARYGAGPVGRLLDFSRRSPLLERLLAGRDGDLRLLTPPGRVLGLRGHQHRRG